METTKKNHDREYIVISKLDGVYSASPFMMNENINKDWAKNYIKNMFCKSVLDKVEIIDIIRSQTWVTDINKAWGSRYLDNPRLEVEN